MANDGYGTTIDFAGQWVYYWLAPLLNDNRTLILLTFDETETASSLCCWEVPSPGGLAARSTRPGSRIARPRRHEQLKTLSNVYSFVANATGYTNLDVADNPTDEHHGHDPGARST